jgi:hypothetical protein
MVTYKVVVRRTEWGTTVKPIWNLTVDLRSLLTGPKHDPQVQNLDLSSEDWKL